MIQRIIPPLTPAEEEFPAVNSPEWAAMNRRRSELIEKHIHHTLTDAEREEFERLQRLSLAAVEKAFPRPKLDFEGLSKLREELRAASESVKE